MNKPKIAIVGAGASGLACAWLLDENYDITLYEKYNKAGGSARTITIKLDDKSIDIDAGFEFFSKSMFPNFLKLINFLKVKTENYPLTYTFYNIITDKTICLPILRDNKLMVKTLAPSKLFKLAQFLYFISRGEKIVKDKNIDITLAEFADSLWLTKSFKNDFLYPLLVAGWADKISDVNQVSAYEILTWFNKIKFHSSKNIWTRIIGGTKVYIEAMQKQIVNGKIKLSSAVENINYINGKYIITENDSTKQEFDHVIIAVSAFDVNKLLQNIDGLKSIKLKLNDIKSFETVIAIHSDTSLMPGNKNEWSLANVKFNGVYSALTIYKQMNMQIPIFRSWVTYDTKMPHSLHSIQRFKHTLSTPSVFHLKNEIDNVQGLNNLWFAGVYAAGVNAHESAIVSAIEVAKKLAPNAEKLKLFND